MSRVTQNIVREIDLHRNTICPPHLDIRNKSHAADLTVTMVRVLSNCRLLAL